MIGADKESVWSKIADEMVENEGTRALDLPSKLSRRKSIEREHRWRRGTVAADELKHPLAMTQERLDEIGDENVKYEWDKPHQKLSQPLARKI